MACMMYLSSERGSNQSGQPQNSVDVRVLTAVEASVPKLIIIIIIIIIEALQHVERYNDVMI